MAEDFPRQLPGDDPGLLASLGSHFEQAVSSHIERHSEVARTEEERRGRLRHLEKQLEPITEAEALDDRRGTPYYPVQSLESGTEISAALSIGGHADQVVANPDVRKLAKAVIDPDAERRSGSVDEYMKKGSLLDRIRGGDESVSSSPNADPWVGRSLQLHATLETRNGEAKTTDSVLIGAIVDPGTIIVPESPKEGDSDSPDYTLIGPDDDRFEPIMDMVGHVAAGVRDEGVHYEVE